MEYYYVDKMVRTHISEMNNFLLELGIIRICSFTYRKYSTNR